MFPDMPLIAWLSSPSEENILFLCDHADNKSLNSYHQQCKRAALQLHENQASMIYAEQLSREDLHFSEAGQAFHSSASSIGWSSSSAISYFPLRKQAHCMLCGALTAYLPAL